MKKILNILLFLFFFNLNVINFYAEDLDNIVNYINSINNISQIKTTIIPNSYLICENGNLKNVNNNMKKTLLDNNDLSFVIGEKRTVSEEDYKWLCQIIQAEAGSQNIVGKILVGNVIFNRSDSYHTNIKNIIFSPRQFQPVSNGTIYKVIPSQETINAVNNILNGVDYSQGALYFMNRKYSQSNNVTWFDTHLKYLFKYQDHEFFK